MEIMELNPLLLCTNCTRNKCHLYQNAETALKVNGLLPTGQTLVAWWAVRGDSMLKYLPWTRSYKELKRWKERQ